MQHAGRETRERQESATPVAEIEERDVARRSPAAPPPAEPRRRLSIGAHAPLELALGATAVILPLVLGLGWTAIVLSAAAGVLLIGAGLASIEAGGSRGRLGVRAHAAADRLVLVAVAGCALGFALAGRTDQTLYFAAFTAAFAALVLATRYSKP